MEEKSEIICSFTQKLTYNDYLNFNNYIINNKIEKNTVKKNQLKEIIIKIILLFLLLFLPLIGLKASNIIQYTILTLLILIIIFLIIINNSSIVLSKIYSILVVKKTFTLFRDCIFYKPINKSKNIDKYKFLTKDISEIILTSKFCAIKFNSNTILIRLSDNDPEITIMINYLKANFSDKISTT